MSPAQISAFQANSGLTATDVSVVLIGAVFVVLLVWGVWAMRSAYVGWAEEQLSHRQFLAVAVRFAAMYLVLTLFLLS
ncbi:TIGR03758 family integrating conjugative element protein [Pseudomonas aeruginosa]